MKTTANYGLKKPEGTDVVNIDDFNENADIIDTQIKSLNDKKIDYGTASGTNTYTVTIPGATLTEGRSYKIKFTNANTGAATLNINGLGAKSIVKSNGNALSSGNIKAGQILHLVYTGSVFQLLGEGGEYGTATADKVLEGYTIGTENGIVEGTLKDFSGSTLELNPSTSITKVDGFARYDKGYFGVITFKTSNTGKIDSNTVFQQGMYGANPEVVKAGQPIGAQNSTVVGTFTADATATASQILSGQTAYVNGSKITGTMPNNGAKIITPSTTNQAIPEGYHNGSGYVKGDANLKPENILDGISIFGVAGTLLKGRATASGTLTLTDTYTPTGIYKILLPDFNFYPWLIITYDTLSKDCFIGSFIGFFDSTIPNDFFNNVPRTTGYNVAFIRPGGTYYPNDGYLSKTGSYINFRKPYASQPMTLKWVVIG